MTPEDLKKLGSSERIAETYEIGEMIEAARSYNLESAALEAERIRLEDDLRRTRELLTENRAMMDRISFGGLLARAIGLKTINQ